MKNIYHFSVVLFFSLLTSSLFAQVTTTNAAPYNTAANLVNNVLMGQGVTAINVTSYGNTVQRGYFANGGASIGLDSGVVLSSGSIMNIPTSSGPGASTAIANGAGQGAGDADLLSVAQSVPSLIGQFFSVNSTWDASVIEFDFVPLSDTVEFDYVFGSEEYLTWVNSSYNDAFGFFLSGPGISGSFTNNAINVATVPNSSPALPISISTIHCGLNGAYFNCNYSSSWGLATSCTTPTCSGNSGIAYNGFTDVLTAVLVVQACDTFHMKLAVSDGSDKILDTGVFIEANSFTSTGLQISPSPSYNPYGADTALYEGCGNVEIFFVRNDSSLAAGSLSYYIYGTSQMTTDYSTIPNCVWDPLVNQWECQLIFPVGQDSAAISFTVFNDGLPEGIETLLIAIDDSIQLSCHSGDTIELTLLDQPILQLNAFGNTTLDCNADSAVIGVDVTNGLPPYTFDWSTGLSAAHDSAHWFSVLPSQTTSYTVTVNDGCGQQFETDFVNVGVFNIPFSVTKIGNNQTVTCIDPPVDLSVGVMFNDGIWHGDITYLWSTGSIDSTISAWTTIDTTFSVTITRNCSGDTVVKTFNLFADNDSVMTETEDIPLGGIIECPGDFVDISVLASGGYPPYTYQWSQGAASPTTSVGPMQTQYYYVTVTDICALHEYEDSVLVEVPVPDPLNIYGVINDTVPCPGVKVHFGPAVPDGGFGWGYLFSWDNFETTTDQTQAIIFENEEYTIWLTDGCRADTVELTVHGVIANQTDLALSLTGDTTVCYGDSITLVAEGHNGGGEFEYNWLDASLNGSTPTFIPTQSRSYTVRLIDKCDSIRTETVQVNVSEVEANFNYAYIDDYEVETSNTSWASTNIVGNEWTVDETGYFATDVSPIILLPDGDPYTLNLKVTDTNSCSDVHTVTVASEFSLYLPSGFTPNNDGINDKWRIGSLGIKEMSLIVHNRWGNEVFSTTDKDFEWDGFYQNERLPMGTYSWNIVLITDSGEYIEKTGIVTVLNDFQPR
jgi:gliding motility-associated-like protein